jgi:hypothetical protein
MIARRDRDLYRRPTVSPLLTPIASHNLLLLLSPPTSTIYPDNSKLADFPHNLYIARIGTALWRKLVSKFTMGRLLSRIAKSHSTGSNRRASHVNPYFTQLRAFMYVFRPVSASALPATTSAHPQYGRCPSSALSY